MPAGQTPQFGVHGVQDRRDWPCLTRDEVTRVLARYAPGQAMGSITWHSMRPFSAACMVVPEGPEAAAGQGAGPGSVSGSVSGSLSGGARGGASGQGLVIKRHHASLRNVEVLEAEHAFMRHLAERGIPACLPRSLPDGHTALALGPWTYEVFSKAPGADLYRDVMSWKPYLCPRQARAAGDMLGRLHKAAQDYAAPPRGGNAGAPLVSGMRVIGQADFGAALAQWVGHQPDLLQALNGYDWMADAHAVLAPLHARLRPLLPHVRPAWGHGDWHGSNLLWHAPAGALPDVCSVLDFGMADRSCAAFDLAVAIERAMVDWLALPAPDVVAWEQLEAFMAGYQAVRPLDPVERAQVVAFLPLVHVEFAFSEVSYFRTLVQDEGSAEVAYTDYLLGHARWFAGPDGVQLLERLGTILARPADMAAQAPDHGPDGLPDKPGTVPPQARTADAPLNENHNTPQEKPVEGGSDGVQGTPPCR
ncbi:phosphotransferase [Acetobacter sp. TBRC 12305]|uniref:Phosphotransferase n=1 Tax=Acetobacter garciniae TaxID=2817435 RepID=A0A939HIZ8_9PROT|nr:phosphotransferase [Acetobacter garciniae]MBO1323610.1 phosphotransferase [Acetobacter garciniae]MBX0343299.1 phosphotransferase [Acetobacter garciniae]